MTDENGNITPEDIGDIDAYTRRQVLLKELAEVVSEVLDKQIYGIEMGFMLVVGPMHNNTQAVADYIGNTERSGAIKWLRETADRIENNQDVKVRVEDD